MKLTQLITQAIITVVLVLITVQFVGIGNNTATVETEKKETVYERVMRTKTIRCAYVDYPPHTMVNPETGEMTGLMHDIVEEMARLLELKVEWAEEVGWGSTVVTIENNRADAICTSFWQNPAEGKFLDFTMPLFYSPVGAYVRADDARFDVGVSAINDPAIRVSGSDGNMSSFITKQDFPKAKLVSLPNMTDETMQTMEVQNNKADVTFIENYLGEKYNAANDYKLKNIAVENPVRLFGNTLALPSGDVQLKTMFNSALVQLLNGGFVDKTISKYEEVPNGIYRVAKPFQVPASK